MSKNLSSSFNKFLSMFGSNSAIKTDPIKNTDETSSSKTSSNAIAGFFERRDNNTSDTSEFEEYLLKIPKDITRMKGKKASASRSVTSNSLKMELLEKCYRNIPQHYFQQEDTLDFKLLNKSKRKTEEAQDRLYQYIDEVEICLFNQVTSRFDEFISVLMTIESMDLLLRENLHSVAEIRKINASLQNKLVQKALIIKKKQDKRANIQRLLDTAQKLRLVHTAKPTIKAKISSDKDFCLDIVQTLKDSRTQLQPLLSIEDYDDKIEECELLIKRDFTQNFSEEAFQYVTEAANYRSEFWDHLASRNDLVTSAVPGNDTTIILEEEMPAQDEKNILDAAIERKIVDIVANGWRNGDLAVGPTKARLDQNNSELFTTIVQDMQKFCIQKLNQIGEKPQTENAGELLELMSLEFLGRVTEYYSSILRKRLTRLLSLCTQILKYLLVQKTEDESDKARLANVIEGVFNIQLFGVKITLQKLIQLCNMRRIDGTVEFFRMRSFVAILQTWESFFEGEISHLIKFPLPSDCVSRDRVFVLRNKLNANLISSYKNQLLLAYVASLHKYVVGTELKQALEDDTWQAADIPTEFYDPIGYLLSGESWQQRRTNVQTTVLFESSLFIDRNTHHSRKERSGMMRPEEIMERENRINLKLIKNECIVGGKVYKVNEAFLVLIEILEQYVRISESFPALQEEVAKKLSELCKFYHSYCCQLIIGAGAVVFGKIKSKNITARHLALNSLCLQLLYLFVQKIAERIKVADSPRLLEDIAAHDSEIVKKLRAILHMKIQQAVEEINLKSTPSKGSVTIVSNTRTLHDILQEYFDTPTMKRIFDKEIFQRYLGKVTTIPVTDLTSAQAFKQQLQFLFSQLSFLQSLVPECETLRAQANALIMRHFESL